MMWVLTAVLASLSGLICWWRRKECRGEQLPPEAPPAVPPGWFGQMEPTASPLGKVPLVPGVYWSYFRGVQDGGAHGVVFEYACDPDGNVWLYRVPNENEGASQPQTIAKNGSPWRQCQGRPTVPLSPLLTPAPVPLLT